MTISALEVLPLSPNTHPYRPPAADSVMARALAANTAESITVPAGARYVRLAGTADFYLNHTTTATVPGDTTDGTASVLVKASGPPEWFYISGVTTLSVISAATPIITASFYRD